MNVSQSQSEAQARAQQLERRYDGVDGEALVAALIEREFPGGIALVSSFGTESAVLLDLVAAVDRHLPILFLDTGKLFPETLAYRDLLVSRLGLTGLRIIHPARGQLAAEDPNGDLWQRDTDSCCGLRKVEPLAGAGAGFAALLSGRKRYHGALRAFIPRFDALDGIVKADPIAHWPRERVEAEFRLRGLPRHPLEAEGFPSVGCAPCTARVTVDDGVRAGRWAGLEKTECGIHNRPRVAVAASLGDRAA
jgi:phosphoadenosine phosphosulfate reductase